LLTGLETSSSALATFLNMIQVLAHDLSVTHIYIFVTGRNYPFFFSMPELNGHQLYLTLIILSIILHDGYTLGVKGLK